MRELLHNNLQKAILNLEKTSKLENKSVSINLENKTNLEIEDKEYEYKQFLQTLEEDREIRFFKDILYVFLSNETKEVVEEGINLYNDLIEITRKKENIDFKLKRYASDLVKLWNKKHKTNICSVRFCTKSSLNNQDSEQSVLVSVKRSYSIKSKELLEMKEDIGDVFDEVFDVTEKYVIKKEKLCKQLLFDLIIKHFGEKSINYFFDIEQNVTVKNFKILDELLESDKVSFELKDKLNKVCTKSNPSITYPR